MARIYGLIQGAGGGGSSGGSTAIEAPDSLHSTSIARIIDILSEGEIVGLVNGLQSVTFDGTPIQNSDGSSNFTNFAIDGRVGTVDQAYIAGFPGVENETAIGVALTSDTPWIRQVSNLQLSAVRLRFGVPQLEQTDQSNGNINGYRVEYAIDLATDGGSYSQVVSGAFDGKTTALYERSIRIELPRATSGWLIRVRRLTANQHTSYIADVVNIEAITEVIDRKLRYPNTALVGLTFDAKSFSSVPVRAYYVRGRIINIPSNYYPDTRSYVGIWDGTFKKGWTDNPAWILNDIATHERYGGGRFITANALDKWKLYEIGQNCDEMVDDGNGGLEPRFSCNVVLQQASDGFKVLQDIASVFRGMAYWGAGAIGVTADMPMDPVYVYSQANVIDGKFSYAGTERKTRYTVAQVAWNDPTQQGKASVEYVQDDEGVARYGVIKAPITSFGCTSQAQAHRLGLWSITSSRLETQTVTFQTGLEGLLAGPGDVVAVADANKAGRRIGGRIRGMTTTSVVLDKAPAVREGDILTVIMPGGVAQKRTVATIDGDSVSVTEDFDDVGVTGAMWLLESDDLVSQLFRITSVKEQDDDGQIIYTVFAVQHEPGKYDFIDNGVKINARPITVTPPRSQVPPTNVTISSHVVIDQGIARSTMTISWDKPDGAVAYSCLWRKDGGNWVTAGSYIQGQSVDVVGVYTGTYEAQVCAINSLGVVSLAASAQPTAVDGKTGAPPTVAKLTATTDQLFQIEVDWGFPSDGSANDAQRTEIWYSKTASIDDAVKQGDYAYPTSVAHLMGLSAGQSFYFWARIVDSSGNVGEFFPQGNGVNGQSSSDASSVLSQIAGQLGKSSLGAELLDPIESIPSIQSGLADAQSIIGNVQDSIASAQARIGDQGASIAALQDSISSLAGIDWDELKAAIDQLQGADLSDLISDVQQMYSQIFPEMAGDDGVLAGNDSVLVGAITETSLRQEADLALAQQINAVAAQVNTTLTAASAYVEQEALARADGDSAIAQTVDALSAKFDTINSDTAALIASESTARASADSAAAVQINTIQASLTSTQSDVKSAQASISNETAARVAADQQTASQLSSLQTAMNTADSANAASIAAETKARTDADTAAASVVSALSSTVTANKAAADQAASTSAANLQTEAKTRADADTANAQAITTLSSKVDNNKTATDASIASALATATSATQAVAAKVDSINASLDQEPMAGDDSSLAGDASVQAGIVSENSATVDQVLALTQRLETLAAQYRAGNNTAMTATQNEATNRAAADEATAQTISTLSAALTTATASLAGQISQEATVRATADGVTADLLTTLQAAMTTGDSSLAAQITSEQTARVAADSAAATRMDTLAASITSGDKTNAAAISAETAARVTADEANATAITTLQAQTAKDIAAAVQVETTARTTADTANANAIQTLQTTVGQNSSAIQTQAQTYADFSGKVSALYTMKMAVTSKGITYSTGFGLGLDGSGNSTFAVSANSFVVVDPATGNTSSAFAVVNGQVFMNDAFIQRATITNAVVGSTLSSVAVGANGRPRVTVDFANGAFEINGANNGGFMTFNGQTLAVYDGNGTLRVRAGIWA